MSFINLSLFFAYLYLLLFSKLNRLFNYIIYVYIFFNLFIIFSLFWFIVKECFIHWDFISILGRHQGLLIFLILFILSNLFDLYMIQCSFTLQMNKILLVNIRLLLFLFLFYFFLFLFRLFFYFSNSSFIFYSISI